MILQVGVKLIIENEAGEILLIKRAKHDSLSGMWDVPGGRIEPQEPLLEGMRREVREEINADFNGIPELIDAQDIFPDNKPLHVVRLTYRLRENIALGTLSSEHSEARFFDPNKLAEITLDPYLATVIKIHIR